MSGSMHFSTQTEVVAAVLSAHAALRAQQRGMNSLLLDCLLRYGHYSHDHLGAEVVTLDSSALRKIARNECAEALRLASETRSAYAVVAHGQVVTVGYRYRKVLRDRSLSDTRQGRGRKLLRLNAKAQATSLTYCGLTLH
ncbi:hypothetical protein WDL1P1_00336 (plasmid) [Variovorax sp. WDL1]|uniref:hypothetical protein n=2 Tax=Variovorax TaxID=34072 RepID=UPI00076C567D|nr:hypothetical protein [Variovorax sp. WDL1]KWT98216.1 hypothetical protein APY03_0887 [Variovorax sp. WDL1]PNG50287.1 hypothetical protein CHC06_05910 [Variovorax sp. B2]PNG51160.1 hypothetical protein CHC07_05816 [Variovorax sp. B4]VTV17372.1 hypothetical protein WDL1P1_00336 [Variovorax sp. WDL1]